MTYVPPIIATDIDSSHVYCRTDNSPLQNEMIKPGNIGTSPTGKLKNHAKR